MNFVYQCNICDTDDQRNRYQGSFVCPWCGEGVMQFMEEYEEEEEGNDEE
jgi:uncharacterized Zn finger protein (UPF0148 family)